MSAGRLQTVLRALGQEPRTVQELGMMLGSPSGVVEGMLRTLLAGGYVQPAASGTGACGCGGCSLRSLCRTADQPDPTLPLLRLTPRGEARLRLEERPPAATTASR